MLTVAIVAIVSITLLTGAWLLLKWLGGGAGPVIIITPPPDPLKPEPLRLDITYGNSTPQITYHADLAEKIPARLFGSVVECFATLKDKSEAVGLDKLTIEFETGAVTVTNDGAGKLIWRTRGGVDPWRSSGGPFKLWPAILGEKVSGLEFVDAVGKTYNLKDVETITLQLE